MDLTLSTSPIVVTIDGGIELEISPSNVVSVEIGYGDASVDAYILGLLTNSTVLGRLSDALAAIDALSQAEAENTTSDVVGLATGRRLAQGAAVAVTAHVAASDPHEQYQKESEKDAANGYAGLDASTLIAAAQLGTGTPGATNYLRGDRTWQVLSSYTNADALAYLLTVLTTNEDVLIRRGNTLARLGVGINGSSPVVVGSALDYRLRAVSGLVAYTGGAAIGYGEINTMTFTGVSGSYGPFGDVDGVYHQRNSANSVTGMIAATSTTVPTTNRDIEICFKITNNLPSPTVGLVWAGIANTASAGVTATHRFQIVYDPATRGNTNYWTYFRAAGAADAQIDLGFAPVLDQFVRLVIRLRGATWYLQAFDRTGAALCTEQSSATIPTTGWGLFSYLNSGSVGINSQMRQYYGQTRVLS